MSLKTLSLSAVLVGVAVLTGCVSGNTAQDAEIQGTWSNVEEQFGATVTMAMSFESGKYSFETSFEPGEELTAALEELGDEAVAEDGEEVPELTTETLTVTADYTVESVTDNVYVLALTNFATEASDKELTEGFSAEEMEKELGKLEVTLTSETEINVKPEGGSDTDVLTLTKE